jgi:deazaflavin-dependent oxidoreductase (nitroreductase family)
VALIETRGRVSGQAARAAVGFVEDADGSLLVAAGDPEPHWAANLFADPGCMVLVGERRWPAVAEPVESPAERGRALRDLILKYGTPAERLGLGTVFRLRPTGPRDPG